MDSATIVGLDTPAGAYLARLLRARGYRVGGTARDPDRAQAMLAALGADAVTLDDAPAAARELYLLDGDIGLDTALTAAPDARVLFARRPGEDLGGIAAARAAGRFAVAATLWDHASRLDPPDHPVLAICRAVRDGEPLPAAAGGPWDLGWTPEYVDALWRMLQADAARDQVVATGTRLDGRDVAAFAAAYFKLPVTLPPAAGAGPVGDPSGIAATLGWRAFTHGGELVRTLCEGLPAA